MNKNEVFIKLPDRPPPSSTVGIIAWGSEEFVQFHNKCANDYFIFLLNLSLHTTIF